MPEIITSSITERPQDRTGEDIVYSTETVAGLEVAVLDFLDANNIDPAKVLFSGFSVDQVKSTTYDHKTEDGTPIYWFGDAKSLAPPESFSDDKDEQGEHWAVNPFNYARSLRRSPVGTPGRLGVYDKATIESLTGGQYSKDYVDTTEYGTHNYALSSDLLELAKVAEICLRIPEEVKVE